ncbi:hypothetical protein [Micromonospora parathelypteridis]|uniref:DUF3558 domain-containing protein n=1 Tax=Micromonospora parathelypteridis TaxID=1839617 RepID=A0A840W6I1_9ACTN|nr:hypothetical protein [Micromonospora parathelypteridis]MBB5479789.1 hypothetical protein [Micromonospora parathelypteridis]GGO31542.1 hypothetical protein GCM10011576_60520 [Micromonospora parathelypteridis]
MRGRIVVVGLAGLLVSGCAAEAEPVAVPPPAPIAVEVVAASSGGACRLLDFTVIEQLVKVRFDVAAASEQGDTHTCVIRTGGAALPELTLSVSETTIDKTTFAADVVPDKAAKVTGLGQQAYRRTTAAASGHGPVAEVGWLATDGRLAALSWTGARGSERAAAEKLTGDLAALAKKVDTRAL